MNKAGRPAIAGRRILVKLTEAQIQRASELGAGNVTAGIRKALDGLPKPDLIAVQPGEA